jgi:flagellar hook-basal body complex protein FliE
MINASVAQLRALAASAGAGAEIAFRSGAPAAENGAFSNLLQNALSAVNAQEQDSKAQATAYLRGDPAVSLAQAMIASEQASLSFEAVNQTRNKLLSAYRDIMNMPL